MKIPMDLPAMRAVGCLVFLSCVAAGSQNTVERRVENIPGAGPRLHLVRGFATDAEMDHIIAEAFPDQRPQNQETETGIVTELRVSDDPILRDVFDRMRSVLPVLAPPVAENSLDTFRVRRYLPDGIGLAGGDYHPPHTDWFEPKKGDLTNVLIVTMIVYLTTPEQGGTTYFKHAMDGKGYHFKPTRGNLAVWWSCNRNGTQDWLSDHSSEPLIQGIKWNAARFFYADVKICNHDVAKTILVPEAVDRNVPMKSSMDVMFGTSFPKGVSVTPRGTSTTEEIHGAYHYDDEEALGEPEDMSQVTKEASSTSREQLIQEAMREMQAAESEL
eukprot:TRINITY_DN5226_c0_g1_i1.p1 TRINITY_DN5226_c0_g1~~TRINITY_DN5226_c0_g1_i1.p1  ORF type:complete len:329 (+),score=49.64 TRINITY_DN5226_c0_g1_i1:238-1224(+)